MAGNDEKKGIKLIACRYLGFVNWLRKEERLIRIKLIDKIDKTFLFYQLRSSRSSQDSPFTNSCIELFL